jgi:stage V sporulation protein B
MAGGLDYKEGIETLGRISGMAMPLIAFPTLITSSVATTLVPAISSAVSVKNYKLANHRISKCLSIGFLLGFVFFGLYYTLGMTAGELLYPNQGVGVILKNMSYFCIFMYVEQIMIGIINGLGKQGFSLVTSAVGYLITIAVIWFGVPVYGMDAYIWGSLISMAVTVIMNLCFIIKITGLAVNLRDWLIKPSIVALACIPVASFAEHFPISSNFFHFLLQGGFTCLTVLVLIVTMFKNLKWSDVLWRKFPKKK